MRSNRDQHVPVSLIIAHRLLAGLRLVVAAAFCLATDAAARTWTNTKGQAIEGEWVASDGRNVTLRLADGRAVTFALALLSPADREHAAMLARENQHPAGWQTLEIVMESSWDTVSAVAMPGAFRRDGARTWRAHLPPGAWVKVDPRTSTHGGPTHLLQWQGQPQWLLRQRGQLLQRSLDGGKKWDLVGVDVIESSLPAVLGRERAEDYNQKLARLGPVESVSNFRLDVPDYRNRILDALDPAGVSLQTGFQSDFAPLGARPRLRAIFLKTGQLQKFDSLAALTRIECFDSGIAFSSTLKDLAPLSKMRGLRFLDANAGSDDPQPLAALENLEAWPAGALPSLKKLHSVGGSLGTPDIAAQLPGLVRINSFVPNKGNDYSPLFPLKNVVSLRRAPVAALNAWQAAGGLEHLREIHSLDGNPGELQPLPKLRHLELSHVYQKSAWNLSAVPDLQSLAFGGPGPDPAALLAGLPDLQSLRLEFLDRPDLAFLNGVSSLRSLEIRKLGKLKSLAGIENLRKLERLHIESCEQLDDLSALAGLPALESLTLRELPLVGKLSLTGQKSLRDLELHLLPALPGLSDPADAAALEQIAVTACTAFASVAGWEGFRALRVAIIGSNEKINDFSPLLNLPKLESCVVEWRGGRVPEDLMELRARAAKAALAAIEQALR
jgi:hypothetical protein